MELTQASAQRFELLAIDMLTKFEEIGKGAQNTMNLLRQKTRLLGTIAC